MSDATIQLAYDGDALRNGSMDVRDLAPALLAAGELCEKANDVLNDGRAKVSVRVRSDFKTGSFELSLDVVQTLIEATKTIFTHKDQVTTAKELLEILGMTGGVKGLFTLIKWLKGRKAEKTVALENGNVQVRIIDNSVTNYIEVKRQVIQLYNNEDVRQAALNVVKPLEREGIDTFEVRQGAEKVEIVRREDLPAFCVLTEVAPEDVLLEGDRIAVLQIIKPSFDDSLKWVFSEGENRFGADMMDQSFLRKVADQEISFAKGDILKVRIAYNSRYAVENLTLRLTQ